MSETAPEPQDTAQQDDAATDAPVDEGKTFTQADVDRIIQGRLAKYADYDDLKSKLVEVEQASLSEQERAVAAARDEGRQAAAKEYGQHLARARFDALAGRRNSEYDTSSALEFLDLGRFVSADGSLDEEAITAAVERLVPAGSTAPPSFDGGTRTASTPQDFNQALRRAAGRA